MGLTETHRTADRIGRAVAAATLLRAPARPARSRPAAAGLSNFLDSIFPGQKAAPSAAAASRSRRQRERALPWSGEDGASGHPLMTASAIREAAANFENCVASMWPDAARRNISQAELPALHRGPRA